MDEMRDNLVKLDIFDKLLILAGSRSDISYLTQRMKKASYKIPNIFQNNVIELFPKDFDGIEAGNMKEAIELFYLLYLKDSETIKKKIKIINNV